MELLIKIVFFALMALLSSCSPRLFNRPTFDYTRNHPYIGSVDRFRFEVCLGILYRVYKETDAYKEISKKDVLLSVPNDNFMDDTYYRAQDSIITSFLYNTPKARYLREIDTLADDIKKHIYLQEQLPNFYKDEYIRAVFNFYESRELDSLARHYLNITDKEYKKAMRIRR